MGIAYQRSNKTALATLSTSNGTARNGATLAIADVDPASLSVQTTTTIVTGSVVATYKPQVSMDGTTWYDLKLPNNAANVTVTADATLALDVPSSVMGWMYFRIVATLSGASTASGDTTAAVYRYVPQGQFPSFGG